MLNHQLQHEIVVNDDGGRTIKKFDSRTKMWVTLQFAGDTEDDDLVVERAREITVQALTNTG